MSYVGINNDQCRGYKDDFRNARHSQGYFDPPSAPPFTVVTLKQDFSYVLSNNGFIIQFLSVYMYVWAA